MRTDEKTLAERLRALALEQDPVRLRAEAEGIMPEDLAEALSRLDGAERLAILESLEPSQAAETLVELPTEAARAIINQLPDTTVAHYLDILPMDDAAELREELDPDRFEALLKVIPDEDAEEIRRLLSYPEDSAGQIMTEDFVEVPPTATMAEVLAIIRDASQEEFETVNYIYVLSEDRHLLGVFSLRRVLRTPAEVLARDIMNPDPVSVPVEVKDEEVARIMSRYGFAAIPILDLRGRMLGIVTADDAQEVLEEAQTEDVLAFGGVVGDAEAYLSLSIWQLVKRRLPWLLILFVAEFFTGSVLRYYTKTSEKGGDTLLAQLMLFVPLLIGAGGNAGSQVTTTITRALALGEVSARDWFLVIRRELSVSGMIGFTLGFLGFVRAAIPDPWGWNQPISLSLVVGLALPCIVVWAATVGSLLPIGAKGVGQDPAVMSAPFISTFVDATGLIIYFEVARRVLGMYGLSF
ncbi:magnesium transporter [bacterium]|nr:MAG: magnesium transporter [bacterium]